MTVVTKTATTPAVKSFEIKREEIIVAPIDITWESLLEQLGPEQEVEPGKPMAMVLEAWPGGRWFRDLGDDRGHFWGHVQVIKPPTLLELTGPMFMSYAAASHVQYRLTAEGADATRLKLTHSAIGFIPDEHAKGVHEGWGQINEKIRESAERKAKGGAR